MAPEFEYLRQFQLTVEVSNALFHLLQDLNLRPGEATEPGDLLETEYGVVTLNAFIRSHSEFSREDVLPRIPDINEPGYPSSSPVIFNTDAAQKLRDILIVLRGDVRAGRTGINTGNGVYGFQESLNVYFGVQRGDEPSATIFAGAATMLPHAIDWNDMAGAGEFGPYLRIRRSFVTHHTQHQIYVRQIDSAIQRLEVDDVNDDLIGELRYVEAKIAKIVSDLRAYFLEHDSLTRLHTGRLQDAIFQRGRGYRVYAGRLVLNVSAANEFDPPGDFGSLLLVAVKNWFKKQSMFVKSTVQSAEKTSFQFVVEDPEDVGGLFTDSFPEEIREELRLEFERRYRNPRMVDDKARRFLDYINRFRAQGTSTVLPFDSTNILDLAIQDKSDIDAFGELLLVIGMPSGLGDEIRAALVLKDAGRDRAFAVLFDKVKPWLDAKTIDMERMKRWVTDPTCGEAEKSRRKQILQAFVLQGVYYHLKRLSGVLDYFEKERASVHPVGVYYERDIPAQGSDEDEYVKLLSYLARDKYVSDGAYNPTVENPDLLDERLMHHLPHLEFLMERGFSLSQKGLHPKVIRILNIWERSQHEWGRVDHTRFESSGGAKQVLFTAIDNLAAAVKSGDRPRAATALAELKAASTRFADSMKYIWAKAISDPKHPFFLKRDVIGATANGTLVNIDVFKQELARLGWTDAMGAEADSMQAYLRAHSMEFSPDFNDAAFLSAWDVILEVAYEWQMPFPLIYRPAGDFVMVVIPPFDVNYVPVDVASFTHEVWRRVAEKYRDKPFHDVKKVEMTRSVVHLSAAYSADVINEKLVRIADELGLQTVPFVLPDKNNTFVLFKPKEKGWGSDEAVDATLIINRLSEAGVPVESFEADVQDALERLGIYMEDEGSSRKYRYAKFDPEGIWQKFMKTLTLTTVVGKTGQLINRVTAREFTRLQDQMAKDAEVAKDESAPYKMGYAVHRSMKIEQGNLKGRIDVQWLFSEKLADYIRNGCMRDMENALPEDLTGALSDIHNQLVRIKLRANASLGWMYNLRMAVSRFVADGVAFEKILESSGTDLSGEEGSEAGRLKVVRHLASASIESIMRALQVLDGLSQKKREELDERDVLSAKVSIRLLRHEISMFRRLNFRRGGVPGAPGGDGSGPDVLPDAIAGDGGSSQSTSKGDSGFDAAAAMHVEGWKFSMDHTGGHGVIPGYVSTFSGTATYCADAMTTSWARSQTYHGVTHFAGVTHSGMPFMPVAPHMPYVGPMNVGWSGAAISAIH